MFGDRPPATQHISRRRPKPDLAARVDRANMPPGHLLLLLTKQWLI